MQNYYFKDGKFVIENFDKQKPFASFLPGIAGKMGKPIWSYYVNRGQGVSSFGILDKNIPILEFSPASIAYQKVSLEGFRTFLKIDGDYLEPFGVWSKKNIKRIMQIDESSFSIIERSEEDGYEMKVTYFGMPNESFAALVRRVSIKNISNSIKELQALDGITTIISAGVSNSGYKETGNLMRSWMDVYNREYCIPFFRLRASSADQAEVNDFTQGHFYLGMVNGKLVSPIVDSKVVFGYEESMQLPVNFLEQSVAVLSAAEQITANKVPCGFSHHVGLWNPGDVVTFDTMIGHVEDIAALNVRTAEFTLAYFDQKEKEAYSEIRSLTNDVNTKTKYQLFDEYARQSYLDNFLRGGYPYLLEDGKKGKVYYLYSRKHGDLERDYNWFTIAPEYYSQGNGNFRDANQNRRNDVLFNPYVEDCNIKMFMNLVQIDGYNPLSVNGVTFSIPENLINEALDSVLTERHKGFEALLHNKFTPGMIVNYIAVHQVPVKYDVETALSHVLYYATENIEANFGEGYWSDHWTYNLDLIENYLNVYPDRIDQLLYEDNSYRYFQSPVRVLPRTEKYVLNRKGHVRQYGAMNHHDYSKCQKLGVGLQQTNWHKTKTKVIYETTLIEKLLSLAIVKFSMLDSHGLGIEMEGEKPGWNDAMNGLPGIFGSGMSETVELLRLVKFLLGNIKPNHRIAILKEIDDFYQKIHELLNRNLTKFEFWDKATTLREEFRVETDLYLTGEQVEKDSSDYLTILKKMQEKLTIAVQEGKRIGNGILPTYFTYEATDFEVVKDECGEPIKTHYGLPRVIVKAFELKPIPYFLEAPARSMKILSKEEALEMHHHIKKTELYDQKLKTYRTSVDLDPESMEIGRIRAFTKGWLERESCFLHMTYKYVLGLLKSGLYKEFYEELSTTLVAFMNPEVYGRSTLENSSFIATSCNPDPETHGKGFVSRLTGANTEFLSMWSIMMFGKKLFHDCKGLEVHFNPILSKEFFDENNEVSAMLFGKTKVTYENPNRKNTYDEDCMIDEISFQNGTEKVVIKGHILPEPYGLMLREGSLRDIKIKIK